MWIVTKPFNERKVKWLKSTLQRNFNNEENCGYPLFGFRPEMCPSKHIFNSTAHYS